MLLFLPACLFCLISPSLVANVEHEQRTLQAADMRGNRVLHHFVGIRTWRLYERFAGALYAGHWAFCSHHAATILILASTANIFVAVAAKKGRRLCRFLYLSLVDAEYAGITVTVPGRHGCGLEKRPLGGRLCAMETQGMPFLLPRIPPSTWRRCCMLDGRAGEWGWRAWAACATRLRRCLRGITTPALPALPTLSGFVVCSGVCLVFS